MSPRTKVVITVSSTTVLFAISAFWSIIGAGAGHGSYIPMLVLFPFSSMVMALLAAGSNSPEEVKMLVIAALALLQFTLYGFFIGRAWLKGKAKKSEVDPMHWTGDRVN